MQTHPNPSTPSLNEDAYQKASAQLIKFNEAISAARQSATTWTQDNAERLPAEQAWLDLQRANIATATLPISGVAPLRTRISKVLVPRWIRLTNPIIIRYLIVTGVLRVKATLLYLRQRMGWILRTGLAIGLALAFLVNLHITVTLILLLIGILIDWVSQLISAIAAMF